MTFAGIERKYQLTVPDGYDGSEPLPVVLALHALTVNYQYAAAIAGFAEMATQYEFFGVAPSGRIDEQIPYWFAAPAEDNDDVQFVAALLDLLEEELCIDTTRVFSTGMSNGAQMSSQLACQLPHRVRAVAPVAGVEFFESCEDGPVAVLALHGTADPIVTYEGGGLNATAIAEARHWKDGTPAGLPRHNGVDTAMRTWAAHNGCDAEPTEERVASDVRRRTWRGCEADTTLYIVDGGGHAWPGKPVPAFEATFGPATTSIDASELIFQFFLEPDR
jgi:polyhydroxybutyrate depolymerase